MPWRPSASSSACWPASSTGRGGSSPAACGAMMRRIARLLPGARHRTSRYLNNRAENSHRPTRRRERQMQRFKSPEQAQRFLTAHSMIYGHFRPRRHLVTARHYRRARDKAFRIWRQVSRRPCKGAQAPPCSQTRPITRQCGNAPARLRPLLGARRAVRLHRRAVDRDLVRDVPGCRQALEEAPPDTLGAPAVVAVVDGGGRAVLGRAVAPATARA